MKKERMKEMLQTKIIESLIEQSRSLLEDHWSEAERMFGAQKIKIGMVFSVERGSAESTCKVSISFGARVKDSNEVLVSDQPELALKK
jgi:hypothetical protein